MQKELQLSESFTPVSKENWKEIAIRDLKGGDFDRQLVWKTYDGIPVQPFYTQEDLPSALYQAPSAHREWINYVEIRVTDVREANERAKKLLNFNATGLLFDTDNLFSDFDTLLRGIDLQRIHVSFKTDQPAPDLIRHYLCWCEANDISMDSVKGFYECSVLENWTIFGGKPDFDSISEVLRLTDQTPGFKSFVIRSHAFVDSGCNTTQEIAFLLNKVVEFITQLSENGLSPKSILNDMLLHTAIGGDYFFEIAKLRALRTLFKEIATVYGVENPEIQILASSSLWTKTIFDPNVNMLRNTTEAMSAILGGCDALMIQPHDSSFEEPTDFSRRIALNVSNLLREEAYLDKVIDPAAGSYYLENLTVTLINNSLELFKSIEAKGGFVKVFESGEIIRAIEEVRKTREKDMAFRKKVVVGTNKYPNLQPQAGGKKAKFGKAESEIHNPSLLRPQRASDQFDDLRLRTLRHFEETGHLPVVYLACFGNLAMRKARATFSSEFFETAGFHIAGEFTFPNAIEAAKNAALSHADIVVICSSDQDYETSSEEFARTFKSINTDKILVLAGNPSELIPKLQEAGVDAFIHLKTNVVESLREFQERLFETHKIS